MCKEKRFTKSTVVFRNRFCL